MSARATPATDVLAKAGIPHRVLEYEAPERHGTARDERPAYGREAADGLGVDEERIFKTLVASIDGRLALAIVPVSASLDLKLLGAALDGAARTSLTRPKRSGRPATSSAGSARSVGGAGCPSSSMRGPWPTPRSSSLPGVAASRSSLPPGTWPERRARS